LHERSPGKPGELLYDRHNVLQAAKTGEHNAILANEVPWE
jgi:hypothetical protein